MIKKKEEKERGPIEIDLTGPDGNVFFLMGYARNFAKQIWGNEETDEIRFDREISKGLAELYDVAEGMDYGVNREVLAKNMGDYITAKMMESDYENAVEVFDRYFGSFVILYR